MARPRQVAKLSGPRVAQLLARTRLFKRLDASVKVKRITWLAGPPGSGKTGLVASWLARRGRRHIWYQLDPGDGDVATFFRYLPMAASRIGVAPRLLPVFTTDSLADPRAFARRFFRKVGEHASVPSVLVLDDYHVVSAESQLHSALLEGLTELPSGMSVVVCSRDDPPPALARMRVSSDLEVITSTELALTGSEASAVAGLWGYRAHSSELVERLHARAEGWVAGLVLLLAASRGKTQSKKRMAPGAGPGEAQVLFEYFAEEVFERAAPEVQRVFLETAILPTVLGRFAERITGYQRAEDLLADLTRRGWFVSRLDGPEPAYRYHALFREFLLGRAERALTPERLREVRIEAGRVLEEEGQDEAAFDLFAQAGYWSDARRLLLGRAPTLQRHGRLTTLSRWVESFPTESSWRDPWLQYWLGVARFPFDAAAAKDRLERAYRLFRESGDVGGTYLAWAAVVEAYVYELQDLAPLDDWITELDELTRLEPRIPSPEVEARVAAAALAALAHRQPWHRSLPDWEERALRVAVSPGDASLRMGAGRILAIHYGWWARDLTKARLLVDALRPLAASKAADPATSIFWHIAEAALHYHHSQFGACLATVERGLAVSAESGFRTWDPLLLVLRCWAGILTGDVAIATRAIEEMASGVAPPARLNLCVFHYAAALLARFRKEPDLAREHGHAAWSLARAAGMPLAEVTCEMAWVLSLPPNDQSVEEMLAEVLGKARSFRARIIEGACLLAMGLKAARSGEEEAARARVAEGFAVMKDLGALNSWLSAKDLAECCAIALEHGIYVEHVTELIRRRGLRMPERARWLERWPRPLRIEALGQLSVIREGERLKPSRKAQKKPLDLLRLLVVRGPKGASLDDAAEALWPDSEGDAAHHALEMAVHRLRKLLGYPAAVVLRDGRVFLDPATAMVDAWLLDELLQRAESRSERRAEEAAILRERISSLAREIQGSAGDPALEAGRERLRKRVDRALLVLDAEGKESVSHR